ncbi:hypothetical protein [Singulisphaera sp. GP187]|uniref:hypothetical protein n=1 Tax=Singulisphaera sp. GP187 TaxID=1882752 RepID=UPI0013564FB0|nr:hypothetical protein [Singulisphaera sp. GP187]
METFHDFITNRKVLSDHMSRIGYGLAGGRWEEVKPIIADELTSQDVEVTVYCTE